MNLASTVALRAYGTSEGVRKEWDLRGRKLYHGTDWRSAIDIARHGLDPNRADTAGHAGQRNYFGEDRSKAVYTTVDRKAAEGYGESKQGERFAVVHLQPDADALKRTSVDQESVDNKGPKEGSKSFITQGRIRPENVTGVSFYRNYQGKNSVVNQWSNKGKDAVDRLEQRMKLEAASQFGTTGWQYGRNIARDVGYVPAKTYAGFPTSVSNVSRGRTGTVKPHAAGRIARPRAIKGPNVHRPNPSGHAALNVRKPNLSIHHLEGETIPKLKADIGGEPMTGNMGHFHMEPNVWFHPPSLQKRNSKESLRVPTDDPGETNDKFGDVTKRHSPDTEEFKMKLLKRSAPGGLPAQIPARTTLISPHSGWYQPTGTGMFGAARAARSRRLGYQNRRGMFVSFKNRGRI